MISLRPYQLEAVNACAQALKHSNNALIVAATGAGKSLIIANICQRFLERNVRARVLVLCYIQEVLESNNSACIAFNLDSGIYCAGINRRDKGNRVIHASRDSLGVNPMACGTFDMIIVDEAHMLSEDLDSRYQKIIASLSPKYLIGTTATPYRLDGGFIYGKRKSFQSVCYSISHESLVKQGFLVSYVFPKKQNQLVQTSGLKVTAGDFDIKQLDLLLSDKRIISESILIWQREAVERKCSLFFCHSVAHAQMVTEIFKSMFPQFAIGYLDGTTDKVTRSKLMRDAVQGKLKVVIQVMTLTTGTNIPCIDCVVWLRPTMSAVLFVQGSGRGSRLSADKKDCLIIDVVGNMDRFVSLYQPTLTVNPKSKKQEFSDEEYLAMGIDPSLMKGKVPTKECKKCGTIVAAAAKKCDHCDKLFISLQDPFMQAASRTATILEMTGQNGIAASGKRTYIVTYRTDVGVFKEWIHASEFWDRARYQNRKTMCSNNLPKKLLIKLNPKNLSMPILSPSYVESQTCKG